MERRNDMRKLLIKETATLTELWIFYSSEHHQREFAFFFDPYKFIPYTKREREATANKLHGIAQALYNDPIKFKNALSMPSYTNLLDQPLTCRLIFVDDVLVAIGKEENDAFCHLVTGHVLDEETLFKIYKDKKQKKVLAEINSLTQTLNKKKSDYEELKKMTS